MKLLIWIVIVFLVLAWIMRSKQAARQAGLQETPPRTQGGNGKPEVMLPCKHCGVHIPVSETVQHASGSVFCCEEHRRQVFPSC